MEVTQSSTTFLQSLVVDITTSHAAKPAKVYTSGSVDHLLKALQVKPILIKYKPSRGVRLQESSVVTSKDFLEEILAASRFDPDTARSPMLYSQEMQSMLSGDGSGDNSILCLTYLAGSITRIISKLQRERLLSAIKLTEKIEADTSSIHESLQKYIASTDTQLQRTLQTSRLIKVQGSDGRIKKLVQDGIKQYQAVSSQLQAQRKQIVTSCESLSRRSAKEISVRSHLQSWCARYHLVSAGKTGYDALIERLMCWVVLAICSIPDMARADGAVDHGMTQVSCVLVMAFKEQLARERCFLVTKSRSLMLEGGNAEKVFAIINSTRTVILNAMADLVAASPPKGYMDPDHPSDVHIDIDLSTESKFARGGTPTGEKHPPIVAMMRKLEDLQTVLQEEQRQLDVAAAQFNARSVYMTWFQATQQFVDLIELSLSGIMRHFVLSVPADMPCFPIDLEQTVPLATPAESACRISPQLGTSWTPVIPKEVCILSEGLVGEVLEGLRQKRYARIVALVGAGVSVAAGIPDFRSAGGLYDQMRSQGYDHPMQVFTADFLKEHPERFYKIFSQLRTDHASPTLVHHFLRLLHDQGCLLRCYTQNIDGLERKVGLPPESVVEAHGTMTEVRCLECGTPSTSKVLWSEWERGNGHLPRCASEGCGGLLRPAVVFFGEQLDKRFAMSTDDLRKADLVFVMGTSLSVEPFASLVQKTPAAVPRLVVNRHIPFVMQRRPWELLTPSVFTNRRPLRKDASILGECDDSILQLVREIGWEAKISELQKHVESTIDL